MSLQNRLLIVLSLLATLAGCSGEKGGDDTASSGQVVNLYSARHYDSDAQIYDAFTRDTGIRVRRIEAPADQLIARMKAEGAQSPADVLIIADAGSMAIAADAGLLQATPDAGLESRVAANLRDPQDRWYAVSRRARVVAYDAAKVRPEEVATYDQLASPRFRGKLCVRSSDNPYNLSLLSALIERWGADRARAWAKGVVANMARPPQGGDIDQIRAVGAGQCEVAITNSYYYLRIAGSPAAQDKALVGRVLLAWPSLDGRGAHENVSGAGVAAHAPNRANAVRFLNYLLEARAQGIFASATNEFPVVAGTPMPDRVARYAAMPVDPIPVGAYGARQAEAQRLFEEAGWR
ncbi:MAG: extracellular solute-binding protein [Caulobacteraceae bacterium]|nr:extracellular solute-binding protein [Caulobacteraceae bacterium]